MLLAAELTTQSLSSQLTWAPGGVAGNSEQHQLLHTLLAPARDLCPLPASKQPPEPLLLVILSLMRQGKEKG